MWAFRTGKIDQYGNPERFMLPTYAKDVKEYLNNPAGTLSNKVHPAISLGLDVLARNKESYTGNQIRDTDENYLVQLAQAGGYAAKQFTPFWVRGFAKAGDVTGSNPAEIAKQSISAIEKNPAKQLAPLVGINPAPAAFSQSIATQRLVELKKDDAREGGKTKAVQERRDFIKDAKTRYASGEESLTSLVKEAQEKGISLSQDHIKEIAVVKAPAEYRDHLHKEILISGRSMQELVLNKKSIWNDMTPEEKESFRPLLLKKIGGANITIDNKKRAYEILTEGTTKKPSIRTKITAEDLAS
jgi:hypothetical protein